MSLTFSICTCTYNSEKHLAQCIESVQSQDYKNIEQIFIDGMSTDSTLDIIHKYYPNPRIYQKKDSGVYDAFNRAIGLVTGDVFGFLHSDDFYSTTTCISRIADVLINHPDIDYYSAQLIVWDAVHKKEIAILGAPMHRPSLGERFKVSNYFAHPACYCRKKTIPIVGQYDLQYKIASDVDWMRRLQNTKLKQYFDPVPIVYLRNSGTSGVRIFRALIEEYQISNKYEGFGIHNVSVFLWHLLRRFIRRVLEVLNLFAIIRIVRNLLR